VGNHISNLAVRWTRVGRRLSNVGSTKGGSAGEGNGMPDIERQGVVSLTVPRQQVARGVWGDVTRGRGRRRRRSGSL
jgi:hypothetical protein